MRFDVAVARVTGALAESPGVPDASAVRRLSGGACDFRWLGHAGVSVDFAGCCAVFDPVVAPRLLPGFPRRLPVVPPHAARPSLALISHAHLDHCHGPSLESLDPEVIAVPRGAESLLPPRLRARAVGLAPGDRAEIAGLTVTAHPMRHPGWRRPFGRVYPPLGYTVSRGGFRVFHAGDSASSPVFAEIGREFRPDAVFLPIGAYAPRFVLSDKHMTPEEAVEAGLALRAKRVVPIHFGTFRLSFEPLSEPFPRFVAAAREAGLAWAEPWAREV